MDQAAPEHPEHQRWVKQTLVEDTQKWMQGLPPSAQLTYPQIEQKINEDVRLHYAKERDNALPIAPAKPKVERSDDPARDLAAEKGFEFKRSPDSGKIAQPGFTRNAMSCKFCGTCRNCSRMKRVSELVKTTRDSTGNVLALYPGLAGELMRLFWHKRSKTGPFAEITKKRDISRIFNRGIDDICDRSVPILGKWWV